MSKKEKYVPFSATLPQMVMEALDRVKERKLINNRSALLLELLIPRLRDLDEQFDREMRLKTRGE